MKKMVTLGLAALALGLPLTYVIAQSRTVEPLPSVTPADAMPAYELATRLRMLELEPQGEPLRRGPYYVLHAADARGRILRVVADAELGDILSITPARTPLYRTPGAPRIIHVPEPSAAPEARIDGRDRLARRSAEIAPADPADAAAPTVAPEPAPLDRRNTLAGPPAEGAVRDPLTPVYPTIRYNRAQPATPAAADAAQPGRPVDAGPASAAAQPDGTR